MLNKIVTLLLLTSLIACQSTTADKQEKTRLTIDQQLSSERSDVDIQAQRARAKALIRKQTLAEIYHAILVLEPAEDLIASAEYRLVQLKVDDFDESDNSHALPLSLSVGEQTTDAESLQNLLLLEQVELQQNAAKLNDLVSSYQTIINKYPNHAENEFVRYQLAKAFDLQGEQEASLKEIEHLLQLYPNTQWLTELQFRRGDIYYAWGDYENALTAFNAAIASQQGVQYTSPDYLLNASYMAAWSLFKLARFNQADHAFIGVLDLIIKQQEIIIEPNKANFRFANLTDSAKNIAEDSLRVLSVSLSQQAQVASLDQLVAAHNQPLYQHELYIALAEFLMKKRLKVDAENTYKAYVVNNPRSFWSVRFSLILIELYKKQGRKDDVLLARTDFIKQFGVNSEVWPYLTVDLKNEMHPALLQFNYQASHAAYAAAQSEHTQARAFYFKEAATKLEQYLKTLAYNTYGTTDDLAKYLLAESYYQAKNYRKALALYTVMGHLYQASANQLQQDAYKPLPEIITGYQQDSSLLNKEVSIAVESAYRIILIRQHLVELAYQGDFSQIDTLLQEKGDIIDELLQNKILSESDFIQYHHHDSRAISVALKAAEESFAIDRPYQGISFVDWVITIIQQPPHNKLHNNQEKKQALQTAWLMKANHEYELNFYDKAEQGYLTALNYLDKKQSNYQETRALVASSIYFQAQAAKHTAPVKAVEHLLRLGRAIPESAYRKTAEFDAANLLIELEDWRYAERVLKQYQKDHPQAALTATIPAKLAMVYEKEQRWDLAAAQINIIKSHETDPETQQELQYTLAEFYQKAGLTDKARLAYREYAHTYPEPFAIAQEVRFKMSEYYQQDREATKRYFWFRKILQSHQQVVKENREVDLGRSLMLASTAAYGLASAHQQSFKRIKLKIPLQNSLKKKQQSMSKAIDYYQQVLNFGIAETVPNATFQLAEMYRILAEDLLAAESPKGLDELALEEYQIIVEEMAYPFEEKAIEVHKANAERSWQNTYDDWVKASFDKLNTLLPAIYNKTELEEDYVDLVY